MVLLQKKTIGGFMSGYEYRDSLDEWEPFFEYEIQEYEDNLLPLLGESYISKSGK